MNAKVTALKTARAESALALRNFLPLCQLRFGHDFPGADIHARRTDREAEIKALVASIANDGVLQSLLVCAGPLGDEHFYVIAGNRRLAALQFLRDTNVHGEGQQLVDDSYAVPVLIREGVTPGTALALSLAESVNQVPLHPIDRYEAFAAIEGTPGEIAARFGTSEKIVRQALALGRLAPKIRAAWRESEITVNAAKAFTLAKDHKDQEKHFAALKKQHMLTEHRIREHILGNQQNIENLILFVGKDDYESAGGRVIEDLFREKHGVDDPAKLTALAHEKLLAECKRLVEEGWAWAEPREALPHDHRSWQRVTPEPKFTPEERKRRKEIETQIRALEEGESNDWEKEEALNEEHDAIGQVASLRSFSVAEKAAGGCALEISSDGKLEIDAGYVMPKKVAKAVENAIERGGSAEDAFEELGDEPTAARPKAKAKKPGEPDTIPQALFVELGHQLTHAAADAIEDEPTLAIAALLAAIAGGFESEGPVRMQLTGMHAGDIKFAAKGNSFEDNLKRYAKLKLADQAKLLAMSLSAALTLRADRDRMLEDRVLLNTIDAKRMNKALRGRFEPGFYFQSVTKRMCLMAIEEAVGAEAARSVEKNTKGEIADFAVENCAAKGWLPPELRTGHYDGPKAKAKAGTKPKAKKKAKRK